MLVTILRPLLVVGYGSNMAAVFAALMDQYPESMPKKVMALDEISNLVSERHGDDDSFGEDEDEDRDLPVVITMKRIFQILDGGVYD